MSTCRVFSCVVGRGCLLWPVHSLQIPLFLASWASLSEVNMILYMTFLNFPMFTIYIYIYILTIHIYFICVCGCVCVCVCIYSWTSLVSQRVKNLPAVQRPGFDPWVGKTPWRRKWLPTLVFLPRESHGQRSLAVYSPWSHKMSDTTEWLSLHFTSYIHTHNSLGLESEAYRLQFTERMYVSRALWCGAQHRQNRSEFLINILLCPESEKPESLRIPMVLSSSVTMNHDN